VSERSRTRKTRTFGLKKTTGARIIIFFSSVRCPRSSSLLWPYATALCILIRVSAILYSYMAVVPSACVFRRSRRPLSRVRPVRIRRLAVLWMDIRIYISAYSAGNRKHTSRVKGAARVLRVSIKSFPRLRRRRPFSPYADKYYALFVTSLLLSFYRPEFRSSVVHPTGKSPPSHIVRP